MASSHSGPSLSTSDAPKPYKRPDAQMKSKDGGSSLSVSSLHYQDSEPKRARFAQSNRPVGFSTTEEEVLRERRTRGRRVTSGKTDGIPSSTLTDTNQPYRESRGPWNLQSFAKTLIGAETAPSMTRRKTASTASSKPGPATKAWGPDPDRDTAILADEIRSSSRSRRREALLENGAPDAKRRASPPPTQIQGRNAGGEREDTLAYIHIVRPTDTLAGIVLIYNIEAEALRRANRLWPNDSIQTRSKLLLPVDECLVKGIPTSSTITSASSPDSRHRNGLSGDNASGHSSRRTNTELPSRDSEAITQLGTKPTDLNLAQRPTGAVGSPDQASKAPWQHHSHVVIEPVGVVEIARLPRPQLSYFPPHQHRSALVDSSPPLETEYDPGIGQMIGEIAKDSLEGLEQVGSAIESFFRKVTVRAGNWVAKEGGDLIELTQRLAVNSDHDRRAPSQGNDCSASSFARENVGTGSTSSVFPRATSRNHSRSRAREETGLI